MLTKNLDTPDYWDEKAEKTLKSSSARPAWVYAKKYWTAKFLTICREAYSFTEVKDGSLKILKTDLWNEGIETERQVVRKIRDFIPEGEFFGVDISAYVVSKAASNHDYLNVAQSSVANLPFKPSTFSLLLDLSTIDHADASLRRKIIKEYQNALEPGGVLALVFDNRGLPFYFNLSSDIVEMLARKPRKTKFALLNFGPDAIEQLKKYVMDMHFEVLKEGIVGLNIGIDTLFLSRNSRFFSLLLNFELVQRAINNLENSRLSKSLTFFALQYYLICRKR